MTLQPGLTLDQSFFSVANPASGTYAGQIPYGQPNSAPPPQSQMTQPEIQGEDVYQVMAMHSTEICPGLSPHYWALTCHQRL